MFSRLNSFLNNLFEKANTFSDNFSGVLDKLKNQNGDKKQSFFTHFFNPGSQNNEILRNLSRKIVTPSFVPGITLDDKAVNNFGSANRISGAFYVNKSGNTAPVRQSPPINQKELESRANRIYNRFQNNGPLSLAQQTPLADIQNDIAGLSPSEAKALRTVYQKKYNRDLLADVARELPTIQERRNAFSILAPENVHEQINPLASRQEGTGIIADPPLSEVVEGTDISFTLSQPASFKASDTPEDYVRFAYKDAPDGTGDAQTKFPAQYDKAGNHRVTFEVYQPGNPVPQYYTMQQTVRKADDKAAEALQNLGQVPTDPNLLLKGVDVQIEMLEGRLGELKNDLAKFLPESPFQIQPHEQKQLKQQIDQIQTALTELRTIKETLPGKLFEGAAGKPVALKAVFVPTANPQPVPLQLYAKPLGNNTWAIVDATNPSEPQLYKGAEGGGLQGAWNAFGKNNNLPAGRVAGALPTGENVAADGQSGSGLKKWSERTGLVSIGFAAAGLGSLFVFPPAAPYLFAISGAAGATSGGLNIADRTTYGNFRWQSTETALDVLSIAGGIAGIGGAAKLGTAAQAITTAEGATVQVSRVGQFIKIAQGVEHAAGAGGIMLISAEYADAFASVSKMPPGPERDKQAAALWKTALAAGGVIVLGVGVSRFARLAPDQLNSLLQKAKLTPELEALVRQEEGLQKALLQTNDPKRLQELYNDFLRNGKTGRATSSTFAEYLTKRGVSVSTAKAEVALTEALGVPETKLLNLPKRQLNERILKEVNPELLTKYKAGELPRSVEAAIENTLNQDFGLKANTTIENARRAINNKLNFNIGQSINSVDELKQILSLYPGSNNSANRGSIGNAYYQTKLSQGERVREFSFSSELWTGKPSINRRADELLIRGRRTLDIKTGYGDGNIEVEQLLDYNALVKESRNPANKKLRAYLEQSGVKGGVMQSHDYLFLPNATTKAEDAARNAFNKIEAKLQGNGKNVRVFYLADDGNIYQLVKTKPNQPAVAKLIGDKLPN